VTDKNYFYTARELENLFYKSRVYDRFFFTCYKISVSISKNERTIEGVKILDNYA